MRAASRYLINESNTDNPIGTGEIVDLNQYRARTEPVFKNEQSAYCVDQSVVNGATVVYRSCDTDSDHGWHGQAWPPMQAWPSVTAHEIEGFTRLTPPPATRSETTQQQYTRTFSVRSTQLFVVVPVK